MSSEIPKLSDTEVDEAFASMLEWNESRAAENLADDIERGRIERYGETCLLANEEFADNAAERLESEFGPYISVTCAAHTIVYLGASRACVEWEIKYWDGVKNDKMIPWILRVYEDIAKQKETLQQDFPTGNKLINRLVDSAYEQTTTMLASERGAHRPE